MASACRMICECSDWQRWEEQQICVFEERTVPFQWFRYVLRSNEIDLNSYQLSPFSQGGHVTLLINCSSFTVSALGSLLIDLKVRFLPRSCFWSVNCAIIWFTPRCQELQVSAYNFDMVYIMHGTNTVMWESSQTLPLRCYIWKWRGASSVTMQGQE